MGSNKNSTQMEWFWLMMLSLYNDFEIKINLKGCVSPFELNWRLIIRYSIRITTRMKKSNRIKFKTAYYLIVWMNEMVWIGSKQHHPFNLPATRNPMHLFWPLQQNHSNKEQSDMTQKALNKTKLFFFFFTLSQSVPSNLSESLASLLYLNRKSTEINM